MTTCRGTTGRIKSHQTPEPQSLHRQITCFFAALASFHRLHQGPRGPKPCPNHGMHHAILWTQCLMTIWWQNDMFNLYNLFNVWRWKAKSVWRDQFELSLNIDTYRYQDYFCALCKPLQAKLETDMRSCQGSWVSWRVLVPCRIGISNFRQVNGRSRVHRSVPWQGRTIGHRHIFFCNEHDITPFNSKTLFSFYHQNSCSVTPITHSVHLACSSTAIQDKVQREKIYEVGYEKVWKMKTLHRCITNDGIMDLSENMVPQVWCFIITSSIRIVIWIYLVDI